MKMKLGGLLAVLLATLGLGGLFANPASAAIGGSVGISAFESTSSGYGHLTGWPKGTMGWYQSGSPNGCYYGQIKVVAVAGLDGLWRTVGGCWSGRGNVSFSWSDSTKSGYNGVKFRICRNKSLANDPCSNASATIYNI